MAEPARTSPPAAGVAERDALLATKLHVPVRVPGSCRVLATVAASLLATLWPARQAAGIRPAVALRIAD
jgi:ABC-type lipoprotein release transport system permease subunit